MVVQMGMEGGKPNGVGNVSSGNTGHANEDVVMQLITQAWQCKFREVDMKPYGLTHSTHNVGYSLFQC